MPAKVTLEQAKNMAEALAATQPLLGAESELVRVEASAAVLAVSAK